MTLYIDHVQGDPFAAPSKVRVRLPQSSAQLPADLFANDVRRIALEDFLARQIHHALARRGGYRHGSGKSGLIAIDAGGQEVLQRTAVVITAINQLGIQTTSLLAILGAAGLAIGLALQGSLSNFAAGVMIVGFRPYRVGDVIEAAGVAGKVEEVQIFTTVLLTADNKTIIIPNSQVMAGEITNYSAQPTRRVDLVAGCGYGDDLDKVRDVLRDIVSADDRVLSDPAPTIAVSELADNSVNFVVRPWVQRDDYWNVYFDLTEQIKKRFDAEGISIPYPQQDVHLFKHE